MTQLFSYFDFGTWQMQVIVTLIAIDVLLGIIAALMKKVFTLTKVANFMKGPVLNFVFGFAIIQILGNEFPQLSFIVIVSFILIVIVLIASIFKNLAKIGIPVPNDLKK
jgi:phage-related holin